MGDFEADTRLTGSSGRYMAEISRDWEIWGPCGGYIAALLLRAAGMHSSFDRPATLSVHFLGSAAFETATIDVSSLKRGRRSESLRVSMSQDGRPIAEALTWIADRGADGFSYDWADPPPGSEDPRSHPTVQELDPDWHSWHPFWDNFEYRPLNWLPEAEWLKNRPHEPTYSGWFRFLPASVFDDPFVEAGRVAMLCDIKGWPAAHRAITEKPDEWIAPNMDVSITFHRLPSAADYLFLHAQAPVATGGLVGATGQVWATGGRLLASATQQMLQRRVGPRD